MTVSEDHGRTGGGVCPFTGATAEETKQDVTGPKGLPLVGITMNLGLNPLDFTLKTQRDWGSMVKINLIPNDYIQVTNPEAIERVLVSNIGNYRRGKLYKTLHSYMGMGLLTLDDAEWRAHRKVVQPAFTPKRIGASIAETIGAAQDVFDRWERRAATGEEFDLVVDTMDLSARVLGKALISRDLSSKERTFTKAVAAALEVIFKNVSSVEELLVPKWVPIAYFRRKRNAHKVLDKIIDREVRERTAKGDPGDDAAGLLMKSDLPPNALPDNLRTMFLAGSETTGLSLAWAIYELTRAPSVRRQVEEEVDRVLQGRIPTYEDLDKLVITKSVVDETLRLYPSVWQFPRDPVTDDELAGHHVPAGATVMISAFGTHRNPEVWENPNAFDPTRFHDPEEQRRRPKFAYLPFGGGRRQCIGKPLALAILVASVAMACQRYRFSLPLDQEQVKPGAFITIFPEKFPKKGIRVTVRRRDLAVSGADPDTDTDTDTDTEQAEHVPAEQARPEQEQVRA